MSEAVRPDWKHEEAARERGFVHIGGIDEVGRGPLAGPVVAACVILPSGWDPIGIQDSKKLTPVARQEAYDRIMASGAAVGIGSASHTEIAEADILRATHMAMRRAIEACPTRPDFLLIDGRPVPLLPMPSVAIVGGDSTSVSIAAASIVAKVTRDRFMSEMAGMYPQYGFDGNKGYPTPDHLEALKRFGPCPIHRTSFGPVRAAIAAAQGDARPRERSETGGSGEAWALVYLERLGHRIVATRYRAGRAEIDIVSLDGDCVVFTEVKSSARPRNEPPSALLSPGQQERIGRAAEMFLAQHDLTDSACRFDVIEVIHGRARVPRIRHYRDAYTVEQGLKPLRRPL